MVNDLWKKRGKAVLVVLIVCVAFVLFGIYVPNEYAWMVLLAGVFAFALYRKHQRSNAHEHTK